MKTLAGGKLQIVVLALALACAGTASGQYMNDYSTTYVDNWASGAGIHGYGETDGMHGDHQYAIDVSVQSPNGRRSESIAVSYSGTGGSAWNETILSWDGNDVGSYRIESHHRGWCTVESVAFTLIYRTIFGTVGAATTTWKEPYPATPHYGVCYWAEHGCSSGTPQPVQ